MSLRRVLVWSVAGAFLLAGLVTVAQATRQWRDWGCAGPLPAPPCVRPALWHWSDVDPLPVVLGAVAGALIAVGLLSLSRRERKRRQDYGEI